MTQMNPTTDKEYEIENAADTLVRAAAYKLQMKKDKKFGAAVKKQLEEKKKSISAAM